jgi:hypothetical protein
LARRTRNGICPFAQLGKQRSKGVEDAGQWQLWVESELSAIVRNGWKADIADGMVARCERLHF